MKRKIGVVSLGCPKNLVDSEIMLGLLSENNYEIINDKEDAEILIVNTCGFIESAKQESIDTILEMGKCKENKCELLIVTGCMAERYKEQILKEIPEVDAVVGTGNYGEIVNVINQAYEGEKPVICGDLNNIEYLKNKRIISTGKGFAYLKIAEGCDNCCTYCIIPSLRGSYRSRDMEDIIKEAQYLVENGAKELILIAQDITRYGVDIYKEKKLVELIRKLSEIKNVEWIRLLYCYPEMIDDALIEEMASNYKVCKYIDVPIQHSSNKILKVMNRRGTNEEVDAVISRIRSRIPDVVIRTSFIVGFPGEDDSDFEFLYNFIKETKFERLGVFMYSKEEDTPAAKIKPQVSKVIKQKRYNIIMALQKEITEQINQQRLNKEYKVIVEGIAEDGIFYFGRSYAEAPDIDGLIYFTSRVQLEIGSFVNVKILNTDDYDLIGDVTYELAQ